MFRISRVEQLGDTPEPHIQATLRTVPKAALQFLLDSGLPAASLSAGSPGKPLEAQGGPIVSRVPRQRRPLDLRRALGLRLV